MNNAGTLQIHKTCTNKNIFLERNAESNCNLTIDVKRHMYDLHFPAPMT